MRRNTATIRDSLRICSMCGVLVAALACATALFAADDDVFGESKPGKPAAAGEAASAEESSGKRLYERQPFDLLILNDAERTQIEVEPIPFPAREPPANPNPKDKLVVRRLDQLQDEYEIVWKDIAEVKIFERMILADGQAEIAKGDFGAAYDYFRWLAMNRPNMKGLDDAISAYYLADAEHWRAQGAPDKALVSLDRLYEHSRIAPGLSEATSAVTDELVKARVERGHYASARRLLKRLKFRFPGSQVVTDWERRFNEEADAHFADAKQAVERGALPDAKGAIDLALIARPQFPEALKLAEDIYNRRRTLAVGVVSLAPPTSDTTFDAAARRASRLLTRRLFEFDGVGPQGGIYACPFGEVEWLDLGRAAEIRLRNDVVVSAEYGKLTAYDVARSLVRLADPGFKGFDPAWGDLFAAVEIRDTYTLRVELKHTHPQPAGLLQISPVLGADSSRALAFGPFLLKKATRESRRFEVNPEVKFASASFPHEIIERPYADSKQALSDLQNGTLDLLARIHPADYDKVASDPQLRVEAFAMPVMHCLAPNFSRPYPANRSLRRAIAYGIPREDILNDSVLRGKKVAGCQLNTGPFPRGAERSDPLGYAYNFDIAPRPWEPRLAMMLSKVAIRKIEGEEAAKAEKTSSPLVRMATTLVKGAVRQVAGDKAAETKTGTPPLVLAYPPDEVAQTACEQIQKRLAVLGITIKLKRLPVDAPLEMQKDVDFLYTILALQDPIVDSRRLLGADGFLGHASPYMSLALRQLDRTDSWIDATAQLREIHRLAYDELSLIPLWQMQDYFAYHPRISGVKNHPVSLYDGIENWNVQYRLPVEAQ